MKALKWICMALAAVAIVSGCKAKPEKSVEQKLEEYNQWKEEFLDFFQDRLMALKDDDAAAEAFADSASQAYTAYSKEVLKNNLDNVVGLTALKEIYYEIEDDELVDLLKDFTAEVHGKDSAFVAGLTDAVNARVKTAEGQMFTDFEVNGVKFSDFIGKGKWVLVDFWASWCGPCRREMPNLRAVYDEFKGPQFDMLSVAVWDELEDTKKAAAEENIQWNQIMDAQKIPTDLYGIQGIPHIILFGPDGTIVKRNLRGEGIRAAVAEALGK
jgi:thiol-disulfide isomerase/thioredoxin